MIPTSPWKGRRVRPAENATFSSGHSKISVTHVTITVSDAELYDEAFLTWGHDRFLWWWSVGHVDACWEKERNSFIRPRKALLRFSRKHIKGVFTWDKWHTGLYWVSGFDWRSCEINQKYETTTSDEKLQHTEHLPVGVSHLELQRSPERASCCHQSPRLTWTWSSSQEDPPRRSLARVADWERSPLGAPAPWGSYLKSGEVLCPLLQLEHLKLTDVERLQVRCKQMPGQMWRKTSCSHSDI